MVIIRREDGEFWYNEAHGAVEAVIQEFQDTGYVVIHQGKENGIDSITVKEIPVETRIETAVSDAEEAFWAVIAARFPEATTGDFDPLASHQFQEVLKANVKLWLTWNTSLIEE